MEANGYVYVYVRMHVREYKMYFISTYPAIYLPSYPPIKKQVASSSGGT